MQQLEEQRTPRSGMERAKGIESCVATCALRVGFFLRETMARAFLSKPAKWDWKASPPSGGIFPIEVVGQKAG
jgi:hypothetical protein